MVNKKEKEQMKDFIMAGLELASSNVKFRSKRFLGSENTDYLLVDDGAVILVDRPYVNDELAIIHNHFKSKMPSVATLFYKDGRTFFRSAAKDNHFKRALGLSLKSYSPEQLNRTIMLRPDESFIQGRYGAVQYYQPASSNLSEGIVTYGFTPLEFDYSHIDSDERFKPEKRTSTKLFMWDPLKKFEMNGDIRLSVDRIVE